MNDRPIRVTIVIERTGDDSVNGIPQAYTRRDVAFPPGKFPCKVRVYGSTESSFVDIEWTKEEITNLKGEQVKDNV